MSTKAKIGVIVFAIIVVIMFAIVTGDIIAGLVTGLVTGTAVGLGDRMRGVVERMQHDLGEVRDRADAANESVDTIAARSDDIAATVQRTESIATDSRAHRERSADFIRRLNAAGLGGTNTEDCTCD